MKRLLPLIIIVLTVTACSVTPGDYSRFTNLPESGWVYGDTIRFTPDSIDPASSKSLSVAIRHNNDYEYSNLWLEVTYLTADSLTRRDTMSMELADVYGHWLGKGMGSSYQVEASVPGRVNLAQGSDVEIRHVMRVDTLRGIEQIGVTLN